MPTAKLILSKQILLVKECLLQHRAQPNLPLFCRDRKVLGLTWYLHELFLLYSLPWSQATTFSAHISP